MKWTAGKIGIVAWCSIPFLMFGIALVRFALMFFGVIASGVYG
jgi:hypothetical protein